MSTTPTPTDCPSGGSPLACADPGGAGSFDLWAILPWALAGLLLLAVLVLGIGWAVSASHLRRARAEVSTVRTQAQGISSQLAAVHEQNALLRAQPTVAPQPTRPPPPSVPVVGDLITLADLTTSTAAATQVARVLASLGITRISPAPGDEFDPEHHNAAEARPAASPSDVGRVAETLRPGYRSTTAHIRPPDVAVWTAPPTDRITP